MKRTYKWYLGISLFLLILIFLNPTKEDFKSFLGERKTYNFNKEFNFLFCSIYKEDNQKYLAILKNFINITPKIKIISEKPSDFRVDSMNVADSINNAESIKAQEAENESIRKRDK